MNKFMRLGQVWAVKAHLGFWDENIFASMPPCRKQQQVDLTWTSTFPPASNASRWPGSNPGGTSATTNTGPVFELVLCTWEKNTILVVKEWNWNMKKRSKKEDKVPLPLAHGGIAVLDPIKLRLLSPTKAKVVQLWWAMGQRFLAKHHQTWNSKNWILKMVLSLWFPMYSWIWPLLSARGGRSVLLRSPKRSTCPGSWSPICQWPGAGEQFAKPWASEITVDFLIWFSSEKIQSEGLTREKWWHVSRCQGSIRNIQILGPASAHGPIHQFLLQIGCENQANPKKTHNTKLKHTQIIPNLVYHHFIKFRICPWGNIRYTTRHRPALGAGNISCSATDGDPRWHNVNSQKMLRNGPKKIGDDWGLIYLDIWLDSCWYMLTYVDPYHPWSCWIHHSLAESLPSSPNGNEAVGPAAADVSPWLQRCDLGAVDQLNSLNSLQLASPESHKSHHLRWFV